MRQQGAFGIFLESKNPLLTQEQFDADLAPRVLYRMDNGPLKEVQAFVAQQLAADGTPMPDLNTAQLQGQVMFDAIKAARTRVQVVVERTGGWSKLSYEFPVKGFMDSLRMMRSCS